MYGRTSLGRIVHRGCLCLRALTESKARTHEDVITDEYVANLYPDVREAATCDLVSYAVRCLCASHINSTKRFAYGRLPFYIMMKGIAEADGELIRKYFGTVKRFCETMPHLFQINKDGTAARLRLIRPEIELTEDELVKALRRIIPRKGFMRLDVLGLIFQRKDMELYQILTEHDDLADVYKLKKDRNVKEGCWYVYREAWEKETESLFPPGTGNKYFVTAVAIGKKILQLAPPFWVPWNDVTHRFQRSTIERTTSYRASLIVTPELDQAYAFDGTLFVRRLPHIQTELEPPVETFEDYNVTADRVLKIAFSLPCEATHIREAEGGFAKWFPAVHRWLAEVSAYSIQDICAMYPAVIDIDKGDNVRSIIKGEFPAFTQKVEALMQNGDCEKAFTELLNSEEMENVQAELRSRVSEPTSEIFRPINFKNFRHKSGKRVWVGQKSQIISFNAPTLTDDECIALFEAELPEFGSVLLDEIMVSIRKKTPKPRYEMFRNAVHLRHDSSMLRFLKRFREKIFIEQERLTGAHYEWAVSRNDGTKEVSDHNPFVEEQVLLRAFQDTWWKDHTEQKLRLAVWMQIPHKARQAVKRQGGLMKFIKAHNDHFKYDEASDTVRLLTVDPL